MDSNLYASIIDLFNAVPAPLRRGYAWRMSTEQWETIKADSDGLHDGPLMMLGCWVILDDNASQITFNTKQ